MREVDQREGIMESRSVNRILVNVTPSKNWKVLLDFTVQFAGRFGARLYVVDVLHDPFAYHGWNLPIPDLDQDYRQMVQHVRDDLKAVAEEEEQKGFAIECFVKEGDPVKEITLLIEEKKIDLLIMPTHEEDRIEHLLFGKVTHTLARMMPCSILLLKQPLWNVA